MEIRIQNPWARISEIAARVGVKPHNSGRPTVIVTGEDGENYDVWEVIIAVLDKVEKAV